MLINLNEFINHNTTVNILLATIQNMAESPKCLCNVLIITVTARALPATGWLFSATSFVFLRCGGLVIPSYLNLPYILVSNNVECDANFLQLWPGLDAPAGLQVNGLRTQRPSGGTHVHYSPLPQEKADVMCQALNKGPWGWAEVGLG